MRARARREHSDPMRPRPVSRGTRHASRSRARAASHGTTTAMHRWRADKNLWNDTRRVQCEFACGIYWSQLVLRGLGIVEWSPLCVGFVKRAKGGRVCLSEISPLFRVFFCVSLQVSLSRVSVATLVPVTSRETRRVTRST